MKIDTVNGFYDSGKAYFINQYIKKLKNQSIVILRNEIDDEDIDCNNAGDGSTVSIVEYYDNCACCISVDDLFNILHDIQTKYNPDRIIIQLNYISDLSVIKNNIIEKNVVSKDDITNYCIINTPLFETHCMAFGDYYKEQLINSDILLFKKVNDSSSYDSAFRYANKLDYLNGKDIKLIDNYIESLE